MNIKELHKKINDKNVRGVLSLESDKIIWTLPNNVEFQIACSVYQNEGYIELNYYRNNKKINVTHFHPMDDEICDFVEYMDKGVIWIKNRNIFNRFDKPIWWIDKEKYNSFSERKKAKYVILNGNNNNQKKNSNNFSKVERALWKLGLAMIFLGFLAWLTTYVYYYDFSDYPKEIREKLPVHNEKINELTKMLNEKEYILAKDFFEFEFDHGFVIYERYAGGEHLSNKYGWNITNEEVPDQDTDYFSRIIFVDENNKFVYLFNYTVAEDRAKAYFINRGTIIHPDTKITKYKVKDDGITVLKFDSNECYNEYCKELYEKDEGKYEQ